MSQYILRWTGEKFESDPSGIEVRYNKTTKAWVSNASWSMSFDTALNAFVRSDGQVVKWNTEENAFTNEDKSITVRFDSTVPAWIVESGVLPDPKKIWNDNTIWRDNEIWSDN